MVSTPPLVPFEPKTVPSGFGFRIRSEECLRFLRAGGGVETLDVVVTQEPRRRPETAPLADWMLGGSDGEVRATLYQVAQSFEFWVTDAGAYEIDPEAGRIGMPEGRDEIVREQRFWGIPAALCFMHRGDIALHAAAVEVGAGAVVLAAPRCHGKTTLALAFQRRGYRVLSEDLACCRPTPVPTLLPGPALLRVRPDVYSGHPPAGTHVVVARPDRVYLGADDDRRGSSAPIPILAVVFLRTSPETIAIEPILAAAAIPDLWALSLRLPTEQARARAFNHVTRLAGAIPLWNLYRPVRLDALDATVDRILEMFRP
jgi:hypothetical protein